MTIHSLILAFALTFHATVCTAQERPNIVLILADDLGYENLSCNGSEVNKTPHLDKLASQGMRFENVHSQPICTPTRVQIMTGIYNNRNYVRFGLLDPNQTTFANLLKQAGYETCIAGKWQLEGGYDAPGRFGFDKYCLWQLNRRPSRYPNPGLEIDGKQVDFKNGEFGPDVISDYICEFIDEKKDSEKPFLVYYPMVLPHWPFVPTPDSPEWDPEMWKDRSAEPRNPEYMTQKHWSDFVSYTDKMVGKVISKLESAGLAENTLVIFSGDNGTHTSIKQPFQGRIVKGAKGSPIDDGTHVPFIASWPGKIPQGKVSSELVDFSDILPTLCDAGSAPVPEKLNIDGHSIMPLLKGETYQPREAIYCYYSSSGIRKKARQHMRTARYKLYASGKFFDTTEDPLEENDLASDGIPEALEPTYSMLKSALDRRVAQTKKHDPLIKQRQIELAEKK